ncbi:hypothetical protein B0189_09960 [Moraxella cuniculi]|nr:hypothetical protein B0189_09960 [Moraxella cuniculi]
MKNPTINWSEIDAGISATGSKTIGFGAGVGLSGSYIEGGRSNIDGYSKTTSVCAVVACAGATTNQNGRVIESTVSLIGDGRGGVVPGGSFTQSTNKTKTITLQDVWRKIQKNVK